MTSRENHGFPPRIQMRAIDQQPDITMLGSFAGGQVLLKAPVNKVDPINSRFPEHTTALHEMVHNRPSLLNRNRHGRKPFSDPLNGVLLRKFGPIVQRQPPSQVLQQMKLVPDGERDIAGDAPLNVPTFEQHVQRGGVNTHPVRWKRGVLIKVEGAEQ
ncbi:hypothetical protein LWC34_31830 [Kibdelosporangium philippinense]|uniref:Uncharacterized protein n=1 Tax=Kibdelosporangium philippinense TaxID=211113 RepID=A0ABS8ZHS8_9PSEU|nr:hypothetical protein [Kibdelosporangium philippinense]MCE7007373.1 hypothetical protein [Kibdelosporangium philippinense]